MPIYNDVSNLVLNGYETLYSLGGSAFATASAALGQLSSIDFPDPPEVEVPTFPTLHVSMQMPSDPSLPAIDTTLETVPSAPSIEVPVVDGAVPAVPVFVGAEPTITLSPRPSALNEQLPVAPNIDFDVTLPATPDITLPDRPAFAEIDLPSAPVIDIPTFSGIEPLPPADSPNVSFSYVESVYARTLDVRPAIESMLAGLSGFPPEIEQALFDRARVREDINARKAKQETVEEWSARGFSLPQGELNRRLDEVGQRNQDAVNTLNRDILVRLHETKLENLRFAIQQGLSYEGQLIDLHNQTASRQLQAAESAARIGIELFNADIALYNARAGVFNTKLEVFRAQLQERGQRLEVFRGQLEAARLAGDINEQRIRIYTEEVRAQLAHIEIYKAQIDGARAFVDMSRSRVDQYRALVEGFSARVEAKRSEFQAWGEEARAEGQKADIYRSTVSAFAERVRAYGSQVDAILSPIRAKSDAERLKLEAFQATLGAVRERISARGLLVQAESTKYDGLARIYTAKVGAFGENSRSAIAAYSAQVEAARAQASIGIENARVFSENAGRNATLAVEAQRGIATVGAQLAAGTLSAINLSANLGASAGWSSGQSTSVNWSVDGGEGTPPIFG